MPLRTFQDLFCKGSNCWRHMSHCFKRPRFIWPILLLLITSSLTLHWIEILPTPALRTASVQGVELIKRNVNLSEGVQSIATAVLQTDYSTDDFFSDTSVNLEKLKLHLDKVLSEVRQAKTGVYRDLMFNVSQLESNGDEFARFVRKGKFKCSEHENSSIHDSWIERASVVMTIADTPLKVILGSLLTLLQNTPVQFLEEIILVGDKRINEVYYDVLESVRDVVPFCKVFNIPKFVNKFQARNFAARFVKSKILVFADANVRVLPGWLSPLMHFLSRNPDSVIFPNVVNDRTNLNTGGGGASFRRDLHMDLSVSWEPRNPISNVSAHLHPDARKLGISSVDSSSGIFEEMASIEEIFAVTGALFGNLQTFDNFPGAEGGEIVSFSIKTWLCGKGIYRTACSNVAIEKIPRPVRRTSSYNYYRYMGILADIWFDSRYKKIYKCLIPKARNANLSSLHRRITSGLKSFFRLKKCKPFLYLASKIQLEFQMPYAKTTHYGRVKLFGDNTELGISSDGRTIVFKPVDSYSPHYFYMTTEKLLYHKKCVTMVDSNTVALNTCRLGDANQKWNFTNNTIRPFKNAEYCLGRSKLRSEGGGTKHAHTTRVFYCNDSAAFTRFHFSFQFNRDCIK